MLASHAPEPSCIVTIISNRKDYSQTWLGSKASPTGQMTGQGLISQCGNDCQQCIMASVGDIGRLKDKSIPALVLSVGSQFLLLTPSIDKLHVRGLGPASQPIECSHLMLHSWGRLCMWQYLCSCDWTIVNIESVDMLLQDDDTSFLSCIWLGTKANKQPLFIIV